MLLYHEKLAKEEFSRYCIALKIYKIQKKLLNSNWLGLKSDSINVRYFSKKLFSNGTNTLVYPKIDLTTLWGLVGS